MATRDPQSKLTDQQRDRARPIRIGAVVLIFFVAVFAVFWLWFIEPMRREQAHLVELAKRVETERAEAKGRIAPAEVELVDVRLEPAEGTQQQWLLAHIRNRSPRYFLWEISVRLIIRQCTSDGGCTTLSDTRADRVGGSTGMVPPGGERTLSEVLASSEGSRERARFMPMLKRGEEVLECSVLEAWGRDHP
jgi:hypothetical protein